MVAVHRSYPLLVFRVLTNVLWVSEVCERLYFHFSFTNIGLEHI